MNLFQVKLKKTLYWPTELTVVPEGRKLTAPGRDHYKKTRRVLRGDVGFVVDIDSPCEDFFCGQDMRNLERVPDADVEAALDTLEAQGPIEHEPALDWLDAAGVSNVEARPEPDADVVVPLSKMKKADLEAICDEEQLPYGTVKEMRAAILAKQESAE